MIAYAARHGATGGEGCFVIVVVAVIAIVAYMLTLLLLVVY